MWFDNHARRVLSPHLSGAPLASLLTRRAFGSGVFIRGGGSGWVPKQGVGHLSIVSASGGRRLRALPILDRFA